MYQSLKAELAARRANKVKLKEEKAEQKQKLRDRVAQTS